VRQANTGVICYSPMQSGLLTDTFSREHVARFTEDDWRRRSPDFNEPNLSRNLACATPCVRFRNVTVSAVAVAWTLAWPGVTGAIVGARSPQQVDGWIGAATLKLASADLEEIASVITRTGAGEGPTIPQLQNA
jgi:aryl-alcohol dehydrogenase-like predicted oxidoreductase